MSICSVLSSSQNWNLRGLSETSWEMKCPFLFKPNHNTNSLEESKLIINKVPLADLMTDLWAIDIWCQYHLNCKPLLNNSGWKRSSLCVCFLTLILMRFFSDVAIFCSSSLTNYCYYFSFSILHYSLTIISQTFLLNSNKIKWRANGDLFSFFS